MRRRKILNLSYTRNKICVRVCVSACTKRSFVLEGGCVSWEIKKFDFVATEKETFFFFLFSPHIFLSLDFLSFWRVEKMKKRKKIPYFFSPVYKTTITTTITTTTATAPATTFFGETWTAMSLTSCSSHDLWIKHTKPSGIYSFFPF